MTNQREFRPYLEEMNVFAQDEHINGPLLENLELTPLATEEQIIEAINDRLAAVGVINERVVYVADLYSIANTFGNNKEAVLKFWEQG